MDPEKNNKFGESGKSYMVSFFISCVIDVLKYF